MAAPFSNTCEVMERSIRDRVPPLLTDLYQFTMAYAYWRTGRDQEPAVFELFFRDNPFGGGFSLFTGLQDCLLFLRSFRFTDEGERVPSHFLNLQFAPGSERGVGLTVMSVERLKGTLTSSTQKKSLRFRKDHCLKQHGAPRRESASRQ